MQLVNGISATASPVFATDTVIGPLLFTIFINDLPDKIGSGVRLFADDAALFKFINSLKDCRDLQNDLDQVVSWSAEWLLPLHPGKCKVLSISPRPVVTQHIYTLTGSALEPVASAKYLGATISNNLSWSKHIDQVCCSASRSLGLLRRHLHGCPSTTKELAYKALVQPILEYASAVWDPAQTTQIHRLEMLQRRAARFILDLPWDRGVTSVSTAIASSLKWPSLAQRRSARRLLRFLDILHGRPSLTSLSHSLISRDPDGPRTRTSQFVNFEYRYCRTNIRRDSFFPRTLRDWNNLQSLETFPQNQFS